MSVVEEAVGGTLTVSGMTPSTFGGLSSTLKFAKTVAATHNS